MAKKSRVRFGMSESWHSGWKGKVSSAKIYVDGEEWGELAGHEPFPGAGMAYVVNRINKLPTPSALQFVLATRKELRAAVIAYFDERKDLAEKKG